MVDVIAATACTLVHHGIGEQPDCQNYLHKTAGLLTDLPHMTAELFYAAVENVILFTGAWFIGRKALRKQHTDLDREHGVTHHEA